jgi:hypothetical protein
VLYLISPPGTVRWCTMPAQSTIELATEHDADLSLLEWQLAEEQSFTNDLLQLTLRHGHPCSTGIVIDAGLVYALGHGDRIRVSQIGVQQAQQQLHDNNQLMERLIPGWIEHGQQINARIAEGSQAAAQEADAEVAELLSSAPNPTLVDHWQDLGGRLPNIGTNDA